LNLLRLIESEPGHSSRVPAIEIAVGVIFFIVALGAVIMTRVNGGIALIWPANAVVAALLIRLPRVRWLTVVGVLFVAGVASNVAIAHREWPISILFSCFNGAEIALMVWTFRSVVRFPYPDISIGQAAIMTAVFGIAIPGLLAIAGGVALYGNYSMSLTQGTLLWWSSHTLGACLVGPPIILGSLKSLRRLMSARFFRENLLTLLIVLVGCWMAIRYIRLPFAVIELLLLIAAFRVGGFGASLLGLCSGFMIAALWSFGVRPDAFDSAPIAGSLAGLPIIALLATTMPPIAVGLGTDARRAAVLQLRLSERRFRESMEHSPIGMLIAELDGVWGYTNLALQKMLGYSAEEFRALPPGGPSDPEDWKASVARWSRLLSGEIKYYNIERRFLHKDGHWIWTHVAVSLARDQRGSPLYLIAQIESLEERRRAEAILAEERERLKVTLSSITDAVITTDGDTHITYINAAGESLLGQRLGDVERRRLDEVVALTDPHTSKAAASLVAKTLIHRTAVRRDSACVLHCPDGRVCYVRDVISPILDAHGQVTGLVVVLQDASADIEREQELSHRASHDLLTDLANRFEFQRQLAKAFARGAHLGKPAALLAIDLDRFKAVNDRGGHAAGDAVLRSVANVLRLAVRQSDVVARLGGDEFAVILPNCPEPRGVLVGQQILRDLNPLEVEWQGASYATGASVGLAMLQPQFKSEADWMTASDQACYRAKEAGRGQLRTAADPEADAGSAQRGCLP
jgi:diguanylate cyclase